MMKPKGLLLAIVIAAFLVQPAMAETLGEVLTEDQLELVFGNLDDLPFDPRELRVLSDQEMEETPGSIAPLVAIRNITWRSVYRTAVGDQGGRV